MKQYERHSTFSLVLLLDSNYFAFCLSSNEKMRLSQNYVVPVHITLIFSKLQKQTPYTAVNDVPQQALQSLDITFPSRNNTNTSSNLLPIHLHSASSTFSILAVVGYLYSGRIANLTNLLIHDNLRYRLAIHRYSVVVARARAETCILGFTERVVIGECSF